MICLGVDPGSKKCGWVLFDDTTKVVLDKGHDELYILREIMTRPAPHQVESVALEAVIRYKGSNSIDVLGTAFMIGRLREIADSHKIPVLELTRPEVIFRLTGKWPGKAHKVSKADVQMLVQSILGLAEPIRPQHANDAAAVIVALQWPRPQNVKQRPAKRKTSSKRKPGRP